MTRHREVERISVVARPPSWHRYLLFVATILAAVLFVWNVIGDNLMGAGMVAAVIVAFLYGLIDSFTTCVWLDDRRVFIRDRLYRTRVIEVSELRLVHWDPGETFLLETADGRRVHCLGRWGVWSLYSPERTPSYNGSVEAGIGSISVRAHYQSARADRPGDWTQTIRVFEAKFPGAKEKGCWRSPGCSRMTRVVWGGYTFPRPEPV